MAGTLNDLVMQATGGPTYNDGLRSYYITNGGASVAAIAAAGGSLNDIERAFLSAMGAQLAPIPDMWMQFLASYPGALNDKMYAFWAGGGFSPQFLFNAGEQGVFFEADTPYLTGSPVTCYQDNFGTTPCTAVEQPVGLVLDRRFGLARGAELISNGGFDNGLTGWVSIGTGGTAAIVGGELEITGTAGNFPGRRQTVTTVIGTTYEITATGRRDTSTNGAGLAFGSAAISFGNAVNETKSMRVVAVAASTNVDLTIGSATANGTIYFDNVSVRAIPGNHATQTTAASRPVLSARKNLLVNTESNLQNATGWTNANVAGTLQGDGSSLLTRTSTAAGCYASTVGLPTMAIGAQFSAQIKVKKATVGNMYGLRVQGTYPDRADAVINLDTGAVVYSGATAFTGVAATASAVDADGFFTLTLSGTVANSAATSLIHGPAFSATSGWESASATLLNAYAKRPQLEYGPTATRYQRVNTATDYDTVGFPSYLKFDGVDDFLVTQSIDFTATDKMTVWAGLTKLSDANTGIIVELSATTDGANPGAFFIDHITGSGNFAAKSRGTISPGAVASASPYNAPIAAVLTGDFDIAADKTVLRVNAASFNSALDQGTGNYGNYPIYIGRRGGTTLPFNGQLNVLTIRGAQSTAAQIAANESYIASKMQFTM